MQYIENRLDSTILSFSYPKNIKKATGYADFHAGLYFIICLLVHFYDLNKVNNLPEEYSFWIWLIIIIPLVIIFQKTYFKFTCKDPNKEDNDFTTN